MQSCWQEKGPLLHRSYIARPASALLSAWLNQARVSAARVETIAGKPAMVESVLLGFQIPRDEVGSFREGEIVIGKIDRFMSDGAVHASYISLKDALEELGIEVAE